MPGGYRVEYATSSRASCKGDALPQVSRGNSQSSGTRIEKGALRLGSVVDFRGNTSFAWRHWGCTTDKVLANIKEQFPDPSEVDGYDELKDEDKERIATAYEAGHVAEEDIPETAQKGADDEEDEKPKKKAPAKKAKEAAKGDDEEAEEKPKRKRATKAQVATVFPVAHISMLTILAES
ncbi:hypothetical protein HDZ31DRAFT_38296 [Schizophyllum fasciatum]